MCGITGYFSATIVPNEQMLMRMADQIRHRGPDDGGCWLDAEAGIGFAHRRLSIQDLSQAGHQPMPSTTGRYEMVFNGEIYNHLSLRKQLVSDLMPLDKKYALWRGHSDTETLLAGFDAWGIEETLKRSVGMFSLAVWDKREKALTLARDRFGEKPLYYGWSNGTFLFASELKAFYAFQRFERGINRNAITLLLRHSCIPAPFSIYLGIFKLMPGSMLSIQRSQTISCPWNQQNPPKESFQQKGLLLQPYWFLDSIVRNGLEQPFTGSQEEMLAELERVLVDAVQLQQISDVPLGAFLSGGVDSSMIVALMQSLSSRKVKTFTIGFQENEFNEAEYARAVAQHLGTEHTELYVTSAETQAVIPLLPTIYDEPFSDSSQIPTVLVSKLAKQHVTVSLSGDAGDELFGGYSHYFLTRSLLNKINILPLFMREKLSKGLGLLPDKIKCMAGKGLECLFPSIIQPGSADDQVRKFSEVLSFNRPEDLYRRVLSHWKSPEDIVIGSKEPSSIFMDRENWIIDSQLETGMMYLDMISYLPNDILVKVDRAAMSVSLETRIPFLDHRVVETACRLPLSCKIRNSQGKWILKQLLYKYVPQHLIDRPKKGFGVPIGSWLRGSLREWAETFLSEERLLREGYFHAEPIRRKWQEHLSGSRNWHHYLWDVLMFQVWLENERNCSK